MRDDELRRLQRAVAEDPTDRRAVVLLARLYEAEGAKATVFTVTEVSDGVSGTPRPFSTEKQAREVLAWIKEHEGRPGNQWIINEVELDFFEPAARPNRPTGPAMVLPGPIRGEVHHESIPINVCEWCNSPADPWLQSTSSGSFQVYGVQVYPPARQSSREGDEAILCAGCRRQVELFQQALLSANVLVGQGNFPAAFATISAFVNLCRGRPSLQAQYDATWNQIHQAVQSAGRP